MAVLLQVVGVSGISVGGVKYAVDVSPDVVFGEGRVVVVLSELVKAPVGDIVDPSVKASARPGCRSTGRRGREVRSGAQSRVCTEQMLGR